MQQAPPALTRVHMISTHGDRDFITAYLPLDEGGRPDFSMPGPWLLVAVWGGLRYYGEFVFDGDPQDLNLIENWGSVAPNKDEIDDSLTDLMTVPLRLGGPVRVWDGMDTRTDPWVFEIRRVS